MNALIGVISDTHGLLRAEAADALAGSDLVVHAGDVGDPSVLRDLEAIAPVAAVRGNVDGGAWARDLPEFEVVEVGERALYVRHILDDLDLDPAAAGFAAVITGHSHRPHHYQREGVTYLNPGSAGPRRFRLPVTLARLRLSPAGLEVETVELA